MIGGFFKWHWNNPQEITCKIDEPNHPLNAPFKKLSGPLVINDETYTMGRDTYSRQNVRVLTSVDYSKMCDEDKKKEVNPREAHDYALSWIGAMARGASSTWRTATTRACTRRRRSSNTCSPACSTRSAICRWTTVPA